MADRQAAYDDVLYISCGPQSLLRDLRSQLAATHDVVRGCRIICALMNAAVCLSIRVYPRVHTCILVAMCMSNHPRVREHEV
jgi:hypothetical protein